MKKNSLLKSTLFVSGIVILCKVLGFIREAIIASYYGANGATDAFFFSQNMPSMLFPAICSSFSTAFISIYVTQCIKYDKKYSDRFASKALVAALAMSICLSIFAILFAPYIVCVFAPGFEEKTLSLAIHLTRLTMGSFALTMIQYMLSAILNSKKLFYGSQVSGLLGNIFIIIITLILGKNQSIDILTLTVIGGSIIQVIMLVYCCKRAEISLTIFCNPFNEEVKKVFILAIPILVGNSIVQINNIVDKGLASTLVEGSISALSYSGSLNNMVISIFVTSLSTVLYPTITEDISRGDKGKYSKNLINSLLVLSMILVPISFITIIYANDIVSFVFGRGKFNKMAIDLTSTALSYYAVMYVFYAIREVLIRGFYAIKDTKTPMVNGIIGVFINIIFSLIFVRYMGIAGIALGTSISSIVSAILMIYSVKKTKIIEIPKYLFLKSYLKFFSAGIVMAIFMILFFQLVTITNIFIKLVCITISGLIVYIYTLNILRCEQISYLYKQLKRIK